MRALLLIPFTALYYLIIFIWDIYWRVQKPVRVSAKVISVGNLAVGGSGKTSLVAYIAQNMLANGKKVAVVARGYGRHENKPIKIEGSEKLDWRNAGDEPAMLTRMLPGLVIYIDSSKTKAAQKAAKDGFEYIIIDDGFQHRGLYRDIDIVCLISTKPFGNGFLLPSGILREPNKALNRADIVVAFGNSELEQSKDMRKPLYRALKKVYGIQDPHGITVSLSGKTVLAFCGLGNPESFRDSLIESGCTIGEFIKYRDHYNYRPGDIARILGKAQTVGADAIITTLKDFVKIELLWPKDKSIYTLAVDIELEKSEEFFKLLYAARV